ncbi:MAG TPA: hypothetical protein VLH79_07620 [Chthonomonadales bacterium]|nr:hypothetical protein [Chthonomonadales bacterium]
MAARETMAGLIERLRVEIGDPAGGEAVWSEEELQAALDRRRTDARYVPLAPVESVAPGGAISYMAYRADAGDWEEGAELVDGGWATLEPETADCLNGRWTFAESVPPPVLLTGARYDVAAAAADVLEAWAARVKLEFDFTTGDQRFERRQKLAGLLAAARLQRARQAPAAAGMVRGDAR